jgi:hypothetical protein
MHLLTIMVSKSLNPAVNAPSRVEEEKPFNHLLNRRGGDAKQDNASTKRQRKERNIRSSKSVNESQPPVDGH